MRYVEVDDPIDRLSRRDRSILARAFETSDGVSFRLRAAVTSRQIIAASNILKKLAPRLCLPPPPSQRDLVIWQYKKTLRMKYEVLAAKGSPVERWVGGNREASRLRNVKRAVRAVERFRNQGRDGLPALRKALEDPSVDVRRFAQRAVESIQPR
jgi:hypothetical protein